MFFFSLGEQNLKDLVEPTTTKDAPAIKTSLHSLLSPSRQNLYSHSQVTRLRFFYPPLETISLNLFVLILAAVQRERKTPLALFFPLQTLLNKKNSITGIDVDSVLGVLNRNASFGTSQKLPTFFLVFFDNVTQHDAATIGPPAPSLMPSIRFYCTQIFLRHSLLLY